MHPTTFRPQTSPQSAMERAACFPVHTAEEAPPACIRFFNQKVELYADDHGYVRDPSERFRRMQKVRIRQPTICWRPSVPPPRPLHVKVPRAAFPPLTSTPIPRRATSRPSTGLPPFPLDDAGFDEKFRESIARFRAERKIREADRGDSEKLMVQELDETRRA